jgi:hypothetical protein
MRPVTYYLGTLTTAEETSEATLASNFLKHSPLAGVTESLK